MKIFKYMLTSLIVLNFYSCGGSKDDVDVKSPTDNDNDMPEETINLSPSIPILIYPDNGLVCIDNQLEFSWEASIDNENDPILYNVQISQDSLFNSILMENTTDQLFSDFTLNKGDTFYWRVISLDANERSEPSLAWKFYTEGDGNINQLPFQPELVSPQLNQLISTDLVTLQWNATDDEESGLKFDIYFGSAQNFSLIAEDVNDNIYEVSLESDVRYFWRIISKDNDEGKTYGPIWSFKRE